MYYDIDIDIDRLAPLALAIARMEISGTRGRGFKRKSRSAAAGRYDEDSKAPWRQEPSKSRRDSKMSLACIWSRSTGMTFDE